MLGKFQNNRNLTIVLNEVRSQLTGVTCCTNSGSIEKNDLEWATVKLGRNNQEVVTVVHARKNDDPKQN